MYTCRESFSLFIVVADVEAAVVKSGKRIACFFNR